MLPVYFPFTSVSRQLMDASSEFFKKLAVYQISDAAIPDRMKTWRDDKGLDIRLPLQHRETEVNSILRDFRTWAQHHQGGDISFFKTRQGDIPFFDDSSVAQIRKEIKAGGEAESTIKKAESQDLYPGVFLQMAQDLDEKNRELAGDLESQAVKAHELITALKGDPAVTVPDDLETGISAGDQEAYMIPERMAAWAHIMLRDDLQPLLLMTSNPMVLEDLVERAIRDPQKVQKVLTVKPPLGDAGQISQCRDALAVYIRDLQVSAWDSENERPSLAWDCESEASGPCLSLYVIHGITPRTLLRHHVMQGGREVPNGEKDGDTGMNTVLGVLKLEK